MGNKLTDALIATGKGAVSLFPGGGFLAEYISLAQGYVADKRMNEWKQRVEEVLAKIPRSIDELAQDEAFYSCVQVATMGAMRAYQKEKQELFANMDCERYNKRIGKCNQNRGTETLDFSQL